MQRYQQKLQLGRGPKSADGFYKALRMQGCEVDHRAKTSMDQLSYGGVANKEAMVELEFPTAQELGFEGFIPFFAIRKGARERQLVPLPAITAPEWCLLHAPTCNFLTGIVVFASTLVFLPEEGLFLFALNLARPAKTASLTVLEAGPRTAFHSSQRFVFQKDTRAGSYKPFA